MSSFLPKILYTKNGNEYYLNPDNKLVSQLVDITKEYRIDELDPEVIEELNKARARYNYPKESTIDYLIECQKLSIQKAVDYVGYRLLGTKSYIDVFSKAAENNAKEDRHRNETLELKKTIEEMKVQQETMQLLMMNIAKNLNNEQKTRFKTVI